MHTFDTPAPPRLTLEVHAGTVRIETAEVTETTVEMRPRHDSARALIDATIVEQRGDEIVVLMPRRRRLLERSAGIDVTITTNHGAALAVQTGSADVAATGRFATSSITSGSGAVELGEIDGALKLRTGSGDVHVRAALDDLEAQTGSGDVQVDVLGGAGSVQSGSGDITVGDARRSLRVKTGSGDVTVREAPDELRVTTASGDIRIDSVSHGEVTAKAASGDITAGVRQGTAAWLDVLSIAGRVSSALDGGDEPDAGERRARLALQTVSGDIELLRA